MKKQQKKSRFYLEEFKMWRKSAENQHERGVNGNFSSSVNRFSAS
jgi:hypothetical protein